MMAEKQIYQLQTLPGFDRDSSVWNAKHYTDGQWVRFQRGLPRKMGGYQEISPNIGGLVRGAYLTTTNGAIYSYGFAQNKCYLSRLGPTMSGAPAGESELDAGLANSDLYTFQTDAIYDATGGGTSTILVHPAANISDIAATSATKIYSATLGSSPPTWAAIEDGLGNDLTCTGGVVVLQPFVFIYGENGLIKNSNQNDPNDWQIAATKDANEVNVAATKIVKGLAMRGSGSSPAGLFWSLDSLIRVTYVGGSKGFKYDTLSNQTSVMSPHGIIEYDGMYFWIGSDRFMMFDGQVKELPNKQNFNWFFDGVNYAQRTKIWAMKVPRFGEIWWFFPKDGATECTHAIIFNVREGTWYDTEIARSSGSQVQVAPNPVAYSTDTNRLGSYSLFAHERGVDASRDGASVALQSNFTTNEFGFPTGGADGDKPVGLDLWTRLVRVEPDITQEGDMSMNVLGREFAQDSDTVSANYDVPVACDKIDVREHHRNLRLKFESNTVGGAYQIGRITVHTEPGDRRS